jgi:hypothetical protein
MLRLAPGRSLESATTVMRGLQRQIVEATLPPKGIWGEVQDEQLKDGFVLVPAAAGSSELRRQYSQAVTLSWSSLPSCCSSPAPTSPT